MEKQNLEQLRYQPPGAKEKIRRYTYTSFNLPDHSLPLDRCVRHGPCLSPLALLILSELLNIKDRKMDSNMVTALTIAYNSSEEDIYDALDCLEEEKHLVIGDFGEFQAFHIPSDHPGKILLECDAKVI